MLPLKANPSLSKCAVNSSVPREKGSALLTALFLMTLIAIVATTMSVRLQQDIYRTRLLITHDQLLLASQMISFWSLDQLNNSALKFTHADKQGLVASYPKNKEPIGSTIQISGGIYDLQARFNLNNVIQKPYRNVLMNLMSQSSFKLPKEEQMKIITALSDWLSPYDLSKGHDEWMDYYLSQKPPYYPSHQLMSRASEFRLIKGVNASLFLALEPYITALPEITPMNVNTASKPILLSLGNGLTEEQVNELIKERGDKGIPNLNRISMLINKINIPADQLCTESQYFLSVAQARTGESQITVYTVLQRKRNKEGKVTVSMLGEYRA